MTTEMILFATESLSTLLVLEDRLRRLLKEVKKTKKLEKELTLLNQEIVAILEEQYGDYKHFTTLEKKRSVR